MSEHTSDRFTRQAEMTWDGKIEEITRWPDGAWTLRLLDLSPDPPDESHRDLTPVQGRCWLFNHGFVAEAQDPALFPPLPPRPAAPEASAPQPAPAAAPALQEGGAGDWPPPKGWDLTVPGKVAYNGTVFTLGGSSRRLLARLLQARPGVARTATVLCDEVSDAEIDPVTLRGYVFRLNKDIRRGLSLPAEERPVESVDRGEDLAYLLILR